MANAWRISRWHDLYEVTSRGEAFKRGRHRLADLRQSPLEFVRWQVHGRGKGECYLMLAHAAGTRQRTMDAYGCFGKILEIAADNSPEWRGWLLTKGGSPCSAGDIGFYAGFPEAAVERALAALAGSRVPWIEEAELVPFFGYDDGSIPGLPGTTRTVPDCAGAARTGPGHSGCLQKGEGEGEREVKEKRERGRGSEDIPKESPEHESSLSPKNTQSPPSAASLVANLTGILIESLHATGQADKLVLHRIAELAIGCDPGRRDGLVVELMENANRTGKNRRLKNRFSAFTHDAKAMLAERGIEYRNGG